MSYVELVKQFYQLKRRFHHIHHRDVIGDMPRSEFGVLANLRDVSAITAKQLADRLQISAPAISRTLKQLEEKNWIIRRYDDNDRRTTWITMSDVGRQHIEATMQQIRQEHADRLANIPMEDLETFIRIGNQIAEAMETNCKGDCK